MDAGPRLMDPAAPPALSCWSLCTSSVEIGPDQESHYGLILLFGFFFSFSRINLKSRGPGGRRSLARARVGS
jgi:hypothetical protein